MVDTNWNGLNDKILDVSKMWQIERLQLKMQNGYEHTGYVAAKS
jgi:hypothetical protein